MDKMLTIKEVADILGVKHCFVRKLINSGDIKHYRIGRVIRITEADVQEFLKIKEVKNNVSKD